MYTYWRKEREKRYSSIYKTKAGERIMKISIQCDGISRNIVMRKITIIRMRERKSERKEGKRRCVRVC